MVSNARIKLNNTHLSAQTSPKQDFGHNVPSTEATRIRIDHPKTIRRVVYTGPNPAPEPLRQLAQVAIYGWLSQSRLTSPSNSSLSHLEAMSHTQQGNSTMTGHANRPAPSLPTNQTIAVYMQAGIWGVVALLLIASLPRALMRWRHPSIRKHGVKLLRPSKNTISIPSTKTSGTVTPNAPDLTPKLSQPCQANQPDSGESIDEKAADINALDQGSSSTRESHLVLRTTYSRVASWGSVFYPVYRHLDRPVWWLRYSIGLVLAFAIYTAFISFGIFYHTTLTTSFNPKRAGWMVAGQVPFIVFLSTKNNLLGFMLGMGYDKLNVWHRWVGKTMFLAMMAHVVGYLARWARNGMLVRAAPTQMEGWIAFGGFLLLCLYAIPAFRNSAYSWLWHAHWIGYILMFVGMSFHTRYIWVYAVAGAAMIFVDQVCRIFKTTFVIANITAVPELKCTRVEVPQLARGWRAGQHVRLRTVSYQMGIVRLFEAHPFTISSVAENTRGEGLILYIKACGDWSDQLYEIASSLRSAAGVEKLASETASGQSVMMRMVIEGPYGSHGHDVLSTFTSAFLVVGGSGITWGISMVEEIIQDAELERANTKLVHLVWVVQDPACLMHFIQLFTTFVDRVARLRTINVTISVHYTRAIAHTLTDLFLNISLPSNVHVHPGRPRFVEMINELADQTRGLADTVDELSGLVVGMCGPSGLKEGVEEAIRSLPGKTRNRIGGVEVVFEAFNW
ncbi:hypothetical protein FRB93_000214 [Tulasnella sp. JGI-2019a]|nr:hypothetical protein FRB93_000214 [Tulasnella sp. JGI-2019a]